MNVLSVWRPEDYFKKMEFIHEIALTNSVAILDTQCREKDFRLVDGMKYLDVISRYFGIGKPFNDKIQSTWPGTTWISDLLHLINDVDEQIVFIHDYDDILRRVFDQMYHKHLKWKDIEWWDVLKSKTVYFFIKPVRFDEHSRRSNRSVSPLTPFSINTNDGIMRGRFDRIDIGWGNDDAINYHAAFNDPLDDD